MKRTLVFQDTERILDSKDLLEVSRRMYGDTGYTATLLLLGNPDEVPSELSSWFHTIIIVPGLRPGPQVVREICDIMQSLHQEMPFDAILIPATLIGRMLAPRLAKRLRTGLVADVTDIYQYDDRLELVRPAYSGKLLAGIAPMGNGPVMMSVRPRAFSCRGEGNQNAVVTVYSGNVTTRNTLRIQSVVKRPQSYDIRESHVLVSGGGGVKKQFPLLYQLAEALQGDVSASRKIVDQGIAPRSIQVGQSGKIVTPRLYIALGIDGAIQHVEGLRNIETIIAVNISAKAPICSLSDIVVVGDAQEFIERLLERIRSEQNGQ